MCRERKKKQKSPSEANLTTGVINRLIRQCLIRHTLTRKTHIALRIKLHTRDRERPALQISERKTNSCRSAIVSSVQLQLETHPGLLKVFQPKMCFTRFTRPKKILQCTQPLIANKLAVMTSRRHGELLIWKLLQGVEGRVLRST